MVRPPQAYHGRAGVYGKLETMDDIESKVRQRHRSLSDELRERGAVYGISTPTMYLTL